MKGTTLWVHRLECAPCARRAAGRRGEPCLLPAVVRPLPGGFQDDVHVQRRPRERCRGRPARRREQCEGTCSGMQMKTTPSAAVPGSGGCAVRLGAGETSTLTTIYCARKRQQSCAGDRHAAEDDHCRRRSRSPGGSSPSSADPPSGRPMPWTSSNGRSSIARWCRRCLGRPWRTRLASRHRGRRSDGDDRKTRPARSAGQEVGEPGASCVDASASTKMQSSQRRASASAELPVER